MFGLFRKDLGAEMSSLPRKISEFREMYRKDIEEILEPYGFVYEDIRDVCLGLKNTFEYAQEHNFIVILYRLV